MKHTTGKIPLDLVPFAAKAMARQKKARLELDCIYAQGWLTDKNIATVPKKIYNRYYQQCDPLTEIYCHKATRLLEIIDQKEGEIHRQALIAMEQIIKKCWHDIYTYVKCADTPIPFDSFWLRKVKRLGKITQRQMCSLTFLFQPSLSQETMLQVNKTSPQLQQTPVWKKNIPNGEFAIFMSLAAVLGKSIFSDTNMFILNVHAHLAEQERIYRSVTSPVLNSRQKRLADALWQSLGKMLNGIPASLEEYLYSTGGERYKYRFTPEQLSGLPFDNICGIVVSRKELRSAINSMAAQLPGETTITAELKQEALDLFAQTLFTRACAAEYEKLRRVFTYKEISPAKESGGEELANDILQKQLAQAQKKNLALEQALVKKQEALNALQLKFDKRELAALREKEHLQKKLDTLAQTPPNLTGGENCQIKHEITLTPAALEKIALLNIVILGGRIDWQQRLKQKYPNFNMISYQDVRFDLALLDVADIIVVNWRVLGHSLLQRALRHAEKSNKKVVYLGMNNEKYLLQMLYHECILPTEGFGKSNMEIKNDFQNEKYMNN